MIWATLLIGVTVLLAIGAARRLSKDPTRVDPRRWLVLPDEPRPQTLALLDAVAVRAALPALAVAYPSWSASGEGWRADKPLRPWLQSPAPYAVAAVFGAVSLDLTALGLGVPEIMPTHPPHHDLRADHGPSDTAWFSFDETARLAGLAPTLFETSHGADRGPDGDFAAWTPSDFIVPSWEQAHAASHDWWA